MLFLLIFIIDSDKCVNFTGENRINTIQFFQY